MKPKSSTEMELEKKFGKNLKALADIYHETNEELGEAIDIVTNTLSQYMRGERGPSLEVLIACADHFDIPVILSTWFQPLLAFLTRK
jgi:transcriptional regulator with XRE-family HTH domain